MFFWHPSVTTVLNVMLNHQIKQQTNREDISTESLGLGHRSYGGEWRKCACGQSQSVLRSLVLSAF